jgi:hypothetical protein
MKYYNHFFPVIFFCKLDERNGIRLLTLNSKDNKYSFNVDCNKQLKPYNIRYNCFISKKKTLIYKSFIEQYLV